MFMVIIRTKDFTVSPIAIGPFSSRDVAQRWGEHLDFRLRKYQLWSVTQVCSPSQYEPRTSVTGGHELLEF